LSAGLDQLAGPIIIGGEPIAVLNAEPDELLRRFGLNFQQSYDDLDEVQVAVLELGSDRRVTLTRHRGSPTQGTVVEALPAEIAHGDVLAQLGTALELKREDFAWRRDVATLPRGNPLGTAATGSDLRRPHVFISASKASAAYARALKSLLSESASTVVVTQDLEVSSSHVVDD
jgi:hypothetical protein